MKTFHEWIAKRKKKMNRTNYLHFLTLLIPSSTLAWGHSDYTGLSGLASDVTQLKTELETRHTSINDLVR